MQAKMESANLRISYIVAFSMAGSVAFSYKLNALLPVLYYSMFVATQ